MERHTQTALLVIAVLLLVYIAFLKPLPGRFKMIFSDDLILLDTATGRMCDPGMATEEALQRSQEKVDRFRSEVKAGTASQGQLIEAEGALELLRTLSALPFCSHR